MINSCAMLIQPPYVSLFHFDDIVLSLSLSLFNAGDHINISPYLSYVSGALAGCAATVGSYPFDLIRTLLASQGEPKVLCNTLASNDHFPQLCIILVNEDTVFRNQLWNTGLKSPVMFESTKLLP